MISREGARLGASAARHLARLSRFEIGPGLTDAEFARIEREYGFEFADDHRAFLAAGLPLNSPPGPGQTWTKPWPDWRNGDPDALREQLAWPIHGILFDVEGNAFWHPTWGERPSTMELAKETARHHLEQVPKMVPLYGHRYLPGGRGTYGHPVLSIYQTDIIFYGADLVDYIQHEFDRTESKLTEDWTPPHLVAFWRDFL
jgi:hypothetical protein